MADNIYNPEFVKGLFNRMSSSYERMNYLTSFGFSIRWRYQFLSHFNSTKENIEVLDLLTGMGETWNAVKSKFPNSNISALDFSDKMILKAKHKSEKQFNCAISIYHQDVLNNNLTSDFYDVIVCAFGLKTFNEEQITTLALETKRLLKVGGQFSFVEVSKPNNLVLKALYKFYLGKIIPILGKVFLGNPTEYKMLWVYTEEFQNAKKAAEIFKKSGLEINFNSYFFGCSTGFNGKRIN